MTHTTTAPSGPATVTDRDLVRPVARARRARAGQALARGGSVLLMLGLGCGLISSDITKVSFDLPPRSYRFDTQQAGWNSASTSTFSSVPAIPCGADPDCCPAQISLLGLDCSSIVCDQSNGTCAFALTVETPPTTIDLKAEVPSISSISSQSIIDITVSQITYDVTENSLNVDLPPVDLFVADNGATSTLDPSAVRFGTVPVIVKGTTLTAGKVTLAASAKDAFNKIGHHLGTPFVFLSRARVLVPGGTPIPMGALSLTVRGRLSAQPGL